MGMRCTPLANRYEHQLWWRWFNESGYQTGAIAVEPGWPLTSVRAQRRSAVVLYRLIRERLVFYGRGRDQSVHLETGVVFAFNYAATAAVVRLTEQVATERQKSPLNLSRPS